MRPCGLAVRRARVSEAVRVASCFHRFARSRSPGSLKGLKSDEQAFIISGHSDGLDQIVALLEANDLNRPVGDLDRRSWRSGEIDLGSTVIDDADLAGDAAASSVIGAAIARGGNLALFRLRYGGRRSGRAIHRRPLQIRRWRRCHRGDASGRQRRSRRKLDTRCVDRPGRGSGECPVHEPGAGKFPRRARHPGCDGRRDRDLPRRRHGPAADATFDRDRLFERHAGGGLGADPQLRQRRYAAISPTRQHSRQLQP